MFNRPHRFRQYIRYYILVAMLMCTIALLIFYASLDKALLPPGYLFSLGLAFSSMGGICALYMVNVLDMPHMNDGSLQFLNLIIINYLGLAADILCGLVVGTQDYLYLLFLSALTTFLLVPFLGLSFWNYQRRLYPVRDEQEEQIHRLMILLSLLDMAVLILGACTGALFYIDENGYYHQGRYYFIAIIYTLIGLTLCIHANLKRKMPIRQRLSLLSFLLVLPFAAVGTVFLPEYTYSYTITFYALIGIYGLIQMEKNLELARQEQALTQQEQQLMLSQIQPHFLYNALTAIRSLCMEDARQAGDALDQFSRYLRMNMDSLQNHTPVPFEKELEHTRTYLWIEQMRFEDDLQVVYDIQDTDFMIPPLTLQPIAENAVRHGICKMEYGGTVTIAVQREPRLIRITVTDDGPGFDPALPRPDDGQSHVGIQNVRSRLEQLCGGSLLVNSAPGQGTTVTILLPQEEQL